MIEDRPEPGHSALPTESAEEAPRLPERIGDFRIVRRLGAGGMGIVYEAEQQNPKRPVALKVIRGGAHASADALKLFPREIQTLDRLNPLRHRAAVRDRRHRRRHAPLRQGAGARRDAVGLAALE